MNERKPSKKSLEKKGSKSKYLKATPGLVIYEGPNCATKYWSTIGKRISIQEES